MVSTKTPVGGVESRKSAAGNDSKDRSSAKLRGGGRGRDTALHNTKADTGLSAAEFARKNDGPCRECHVQKGYVGNGVK